VRFLVRLAVGGALFRGAADRFFPQPLALALSQELPLRWVSAQDPRNRARSSDHATTNAST